MSKVAGPAPFCAGYVLAGGRSSRMGADKALLELAGLPLIAYALEALRGAGIEPKIAGARSELSVFAPVIADAEPDCGPLGGICAALRPSGEDLSLGTPGTEDRDAEMAVFVSVDAPLMPASAIEYLVRHAAVTGRLVTLYSVNGFAQTFPVVIRREALPVLKAELAAGRRGCFAAFESVAREVGEGVQVLPVEYLAQAGHVRDDRGLPPERWFANVNTREELARVAAWLR